ncbi:hypothetical protein DRQ07_08015 [candidate division KSB1 bacterium]|nr:MAG: hypothetical protein DRQ07_08015 [candidate division KSB1 bacterium]
MKYQNALSLLRFKKSNKFILLGDEPYLKERFIEISESIYSDIRKYYPEDQREAYDIMNSESFFDDGLIILYDFNKMKAEVFKDLIKLYNGCLILVLSDLSNIKSRVMTDILSKMTIVECKKLREYGSDYLIWINSFISEFGYTSEKGVDQLIFSRVGPSMFSLSNEIEKLILIKSEEKYITLKDAADYISFTSKGNAFEIFESLLRKNVKKALKTFNNYTRNKNTFVDIIGFLYVYFEKVYRMLLLKEEGMEEDDIANIVGIPKFLVKTKYLPKAVLFGKNNISNKINFLCNLDIQMRLFKGDRRILFEHFLYSFSK